jgi:hypothetical protein
VEFEEEERLERLAQGSGFDAGETTRENRSERPPRFAASVHYEEGKRQVEVVVSLISAFSQCVEITLIQQSVSREVPTPQPSGRGKEQSR